MNGNADALTRSTPMEPRPYTKFEDIRESMIESRQATTQTNMVTYKAPIVWSWVP
jgi:hypothetical protein